MPERGDRPGAHTRGVLVSVGKCLAFLGIWAALLAAATAAAVTLGGADWFESAAWRLVAEAGGLVAALVALVVMAGVVDRRGRASMGLGGGALAGLAGGTLLGAAAFALPLLVLMALGMARFAPDFSQMTPAALALGLLLCALNVAHQELLVRSYLFQELWRKHSALLATIVTTLLFVAMHAGAIARGANGLIADANVLLASVLLSVAYVRTGALWLPIGIHFGWNGLQGPVLGIQVTGTDIGLGSWRSFLFPGPPLWTGGELGIEGGLAGLAGPVAGIALVLLVVKPRTDGGFPGVPGHRPSA